jgi:hypothetical protein
MSEAAERRHMIFAELKHKIKYRERHTGGRFAVRVVG